MLLPNLFLLTPTEVLLEKHWTSLHAPSLSTESSTEAYATDNRRRLAIVDQWREFESRNSDSVAAESSADSERNGLKNDNCSAPIITTGKYILVVTQRWGITFLTALPLCEIQPLLVLSLHAHLQEVLKLYLQQVTPASIRDQFATIYQLLDELVDGGYPATTELNQLTDMVAPPTLVNRIYQFTSGESAVAQTLPSHAVSKIPWRKSNVSYVTNEIYFDIIESIDAIISADGRSVMSYLHGDIRVNCRLSGMPDLTLTFANPELLNDASLHRCVRINRYKKEHIISFVPPDGEFSLMTYRIPGSFSLPLYVRPVISYGSGQGRVYITVGPKHTSGKPITDVSISLPLPSQMIGHNLSANIGKIRTDSKNNMVVWEIDKLLREITPVLEGNIKLPDDLVLDERPTVRVDFTVKGLSLSGIKVDGLSISGISNRPFKGVRSITQSGNVDVRCSTV